jgi:HAD superfamily hydrolase (TIGR01509 family)
VEKAIIYDFDGVIADSEIIANNVLAEQITALGYPITLEQVLQQYQGKHSTGLIAALEESIGRKIPPNFRRDCEAAIFDKLQTELLEVRGAIAFIRKWSSIPKYIASSSSIARLSASLQKLGLTEDFGSNVLGAEAVLRRKPFPDIFLLAAERLSVSPAACVAIEDSPQGVGAALEAGMTVIGLSAGSHVRDGHRDLLAKAGAHHFAANWIEVDNLMPTIFGLIDHTSG